MIIRFLGHWGPKVCKILHPPQLKQSNTCFFEEKKKKKNQNPKDRHLRWSHLRGYWRVYTPLGVQNMFLHTPESGLGVSGSGGVDK